MISSSKRVVVQCLGGHFLLSVLGRLPNACEVRVFQIPKWLGWTWLFRGEEQGKKSVCALASYWVAVGA